MIRSHSLHQANVAFVLRDKNYLPNSQALSSLVTDRDAEGMNFLDDATLRMKLLNLPKIGMSIVAEPGRIRIEDQMQREPGDSPLVSQALTSMKKLVPKGIPYAGFGFNFNIYYQLSDVVQIGNFFSQLAPTGMDLGSTLVDFGWQWTVAHKNGKQIDGYFLKVTAPLELIVHHNAHFNEGVIPQEEELSRRFSQAYESTHAFISTLQL